MSVYTSRIIDLHAGVTIDERPELFLRKSDDPLLYQFDRATDVTRDSAGYTPERLDESAMEEVRKHIRKLVIAHQCLFIISPMPVSSIVDDRSVRRILPAPPELLDRIAVVAREEIGRM